MVEDYLGTYRALRDGGFTHRPPRLMALLGWFLPPNVFRSSALSLALAVTAMGGSLLVSYARARGEGRGVVCKLGVMQRAERLLLVGFGGLLDPTVSGLWGAGRVGTLLVPILGLVAVGTVGTAIFRTAWIARALRASD